MQRWKGYRIQPLKRCHIKALKGFELFFWLQICSAVFRWNPILIRKSISQFLHTGIYTDQPGSPECHKSKVQFQQLSTVRSEDCSTLADPWGEQRAGSEAWCGLGSAEWRCGTRCLSENVARKEEMEVCTFESKINGTAIKR